MILVGVLFVVVVLAILLPVVLDARAYSKHEKKRDR